MTEFDEANNPLTEPHIIGNSFSMSGPTNWWLALRKSICGPDPAVVVTMCREPRSTRVPGSKGKKNPLTPTSNCSVDGWETHTESNHQGGDISRLSRANPRPCTITSVGEPPAVHDKPNRHSIETAPVPVARTSTCQSDASRIPGQRASVAPSQMIQRVPLPHQPVRLKSEWSEYSNIGTKTGVKRFDRIGSSQAVQAILKLDFCLIIWLLPQMTFTGRHLWIPGSTTIT